MYSVTQKNTFGKLLLSLRGVPHVRDDEAILLKQKDCPAYLRQRSSAGRRTLAKLGLAMTSDYSPFGFSISSGSILPPTSAILKTSLSTFLNSLYAVL